MLERYAAAPFPCCTLSVLPTNSIRYKRGELYLLDQKKLPFAQEYDLIANSSDGWKAIESMRVRGAPAIAIAGALSLAVEAEALLQNGHPFEDASSAAAFLAQRLEYLTTSRPTAVNLSEAAARLSALVKEKAVAMPTGLDGAKGLLDLYIEEAERMLETDISANKALGAHGAAFIHKLVNKETVSVLTHCNTGSLATAGYGTALGVIRSLHEQQLLNTAYCTETRPYNQGSRLTALELVHDKIPAVLVTDSMVGTLMSSKQRQIDAVVVGADRVTANGDTANKVGTYTLAICAQYHGIPFFVASPLTTLDSSLPDGSHIKIEERPASELTTIGGVQIAAPGIGVWNPAFDVTPHSLITGIITEYGVLTKGTDGVFDVAGFVKTHKSQ